MKIETANEAEWDAAFTAADCCQIDSPVEYWFKMAKHWEARADEFCMKARNQEAYVQELFDENSRLREVLRFAQEEIELGGRNTQPLTDILRKST